MKKICYLLLLAVSFTFANNTKPIEITQNNPKIGDILVINSTSNITYNHIDFPQLNIVAKRGNVTNYKSVHGKRVIIKEILKNDDGNTKILIGSEDNAKFFGFVKHVEAHYEKSITSGEMSKINP